MLQEWRLICRAPRAKKLAAGSILIQFAQLCMLVSLMDGKNPYKGHFSLFMTTCYGAIPLFGYMQFGMGWQGKSLAMYFSRQVTLKHLLWGKYLLTVLAAFYSTVVPFVALASLGKWDFAVGSLGAFVFVAGFNAALICIAYKKISNKIDRQASGLTANWQGVGSAQHLIGLIYMVPVIIMTGMAAYFKLNVWYSIMAFTLLGFTMLIIAFRHVAQGKYEADKYFLVNKFE